MRLPVIVFILLLIGVSGDVAAQKDQYSWQRFSFISQVINAGNYALKVDGVEATYNDWLKIPDGKLLSIEIYRPKEAKKLFGKEQGGNGIVRVKTVNWMQPKYDLDSTLLDSATFYVENGDTVFTKVTQDAVLSNEDGTSYASWGKFLRKTLDPNVAVDAGAPVGLYMVRVQFKVNKDGSINDAVVIADPGYGTANESLRVLHRSKNWQPAMYKGRPVTMLLIQPVYFVVID